MRHERSPAMTRARRTGRRALDELRCAPLDERRRRAGTATNIGLDTLLHRYRRRQAFRRNAEPYPLARFRHPKSAAKNPPNVTTATLGRGHNRPRHLPPPLPPRTLPPPPPPY